MKAALVILVMALSLSACNTVKGIGKDIESAGKAVQKTSE